MEKLAHPEAVAMAALAAIAKCDSGAWAAAWDEEYAAGNPTGELPMKVRARAQDRYAAALAAMEAVLRPTTK